MGLAQRQAGGLVGRCASRRELSMLRLITLISLLCVLAFAKVARADDPPAPIVADPVPTPSTVPSPVLAFPAPKPAPHVPVGARAVKFARHLLGVPYRYGGSSPGTGFDCSGFVRFVYSHFGVVLPRVSYAQFGSGLRVARSSLRPGDLVFFDGAGHVGIYVGSDSFIHAPHSGTVVQISSLRGGYGRGYDGARRVAN
jgi:cell wall-associated NlpC family hydrolase